MHIAICDNNIGDRKQLERLLMRESDKRINHSGVFYTDTYGSCEALLDNPLIYDAYFLDVTDPTFSAYDIALAIRSKGISSPVIFCISKIDYHTCGELLSNSVFLNKPIKVDELSLVLDEIILQKKEHRIPKIEFRNNTETFYIEEKEILYCQGNGYYLTIHLADGSSIEATAFLSNLWMELSPFKSLFLANKNTIANARYVTKLSAFSVIMKDGTKLKITPGLKKDIEKLLHSL